MRNRNEQWNGQGQERPSTEGGRRNEQWNGKGPERPSTEGGSRAPRAPSAEAIEGSSRNQASKRLSTAECQSSMCRGLEHLRTAVAEDQSGPGADAAENRNGRDPRRQTRPRIRSARSGRVLDRPYVRFGRAASGVAEPSGPSRGTESMGADPGNPRRGGPRRWGPIQGNRSEGVQAEGVRAEVVDREGAQPRMRRGQICWDRVDTKKRVRGRSELLSAGVHGSMQENVERQNDPEPEQHACTAACMHSSIHACTTTCMDNSMHAQ